MTKSMLFRLVLAGMTVLALQPASAGSAVVHDSRGHTVYSFGHPKATAIQRALDMARSEGWTNARLIAATEKIGYGAIAVAEHKGGGSVVGVALAKHSQGEADALAIDHCLKAGGVNPKVIRQWNG